MFVGNDNAALHTPHLAVEAGRQGGGLVADEHVAQQLPAFDDGGFVLKGSGGREVEKRSSACARQR